MKDDRLISMKMPENMIGDLKKLAEYNGLSMSAQVRTIVVEYLRTHKIEDNQ